jgi:pyruvate/2-oxoglutarate dehydrogenase complex dihydrolipoamide acyltransferase (E2) component
LDESKLACGTFSIHNLGVFGVKSAAPIVIPPQSSALSLGAIIDSVVPAPEAKEGENNWKVRLSFDVVLFHRDSVIVTFCVYNRLLQL